MKITITEFTVSGGGFASYSFPLDMLRYDQCWPADPDAVAQIENVGRDARSVRLRTHGSVTDDRWRSFGWIVTEKTSRKTTI